MNILYDDNMPYAQHFFKDLGKAHAFSAGTLPETALADCEALLCRSTTEVNQALLDKAPKLRYVATATAGFNHLDIASLQARGIHWYAAGGCNARAVAEYVICALYRWAQQQGYVLQNKRVGIVGAGNVGARLADMLRAIDIEVIEYDPPRAKRDAQFMSVKFEQILACDVISLHTPLVTDGEHPSLHMFGEKEIALLGKTQLLINACRGEVVSNSALLAAVEQRDDMPQVILDCWENEPSIDRRLIPYLNIATAHIAGHSLEGKANGTSMVYDDLCGFLKREPKLKIADCLPVFSDNHQVSSLVNRQDDDCDTQSLVLKAVMGMYDIENDDSFFRRYMAKSTTFSELRRNYPVRREWPASSLTIKDKQAAAVLRKLGFDLTNDS